MSDVSSRRTFIVGVSAAALGGGVGLFTGRHQGIGSFSGGSVSEYGPEVLGVAQGRRSGSGRRREILRTLNLRRQRSRAGWESINGSHAESGLSFTNSVPAADQDGAATLVLKGSDGQTLTITVDTRLDNGIRQVDAVEVASPRGYERLTREGAGSNRDRTIVQERIRQALSVAAFTQFRGLTAELEEGDDADDGNMITLAFPGALAATLDGDRSVVRRLNRRLLAQAGASNGGRRAPRIETAGYTLGAEPEVILVQDAYRDCWGMYTRAVLSAYSAHERCIYNAYEQWWNPYGSYFCTIEYLAQTQSFWWQYIACSAYPVG
jgi:hypothetical protein